MEKKNSRPVKQVRQNFDDKVKGVKGAKFAVVPTVRRDELDDAGMHHDRAIAKKAKSLVEGTQVSGQGQTPRASRAKIVNVSLDAYKKAGASRQSVGSISNYSTFKKYAVLDKSGD